MILIKKSVYPALQPITIQILGITNVKSMLFFRDILRREAPRYRRTAPKSRKIIIVHRRKNTIGLAL